MRPGEFTQGAGVYVTAHLERQTHIQLGSGGKPAKDFEKKQPSEHEFKKRER